ncbi:GDYXXLXY domain-containing protein [Candidatus Woesearchaeota archaeon]|nr:GDYXXLXY domain-containing protein [Candidatus Woesearchaeota archaeon]
MKLRTRLLVGLLVLFIIAGTFLLYLYWPLLTGEKIILATRPVDPFDILRGQYIQINYEITTLPKIENVNERDSVFIILQPDEKGIDRDILVQQQMPTGGRFIKGIVSSVYGDKMRVEYGIEQYFFERNAQLDLKNVTVEVKVSSSGRAAISQVLSNGEPITIKYQKIGITS